MSEALVKNALKKYLKEIGAYYFMPVQMGLGAKTVDFLICHRGAFYGIEAKREGVPGPTMAQRMVMKQIEASGGITWVENSPNLDTTRVFLF